MHDKIMSSINEKMRMRSVKLEIATSELGQV